MDDDRMPRGGSSSARGVMRVTMVVDLANVMGSRPDGWWKDRAGAATRLLAPVPELVGRTVSGPNSEQFVIERIVVVVEGAAKTASAPAGVDLVRAPAEGDDSIVSTAADLVGHGAHVLVVTADRGLRARLAEDVLVAGPGWLNALLGR